MFELTQNEKEWLRKLNGDKNTLSALQKLFMRVCMSDNAEGDVQKLAAERVAQEIIKKSFYELSIMSPDSSPSVQNENLV